MLICTQAHLRRTKQVTYRWGRHGEQDGSLSLKAEGTDTASLGDFHQADAICCSRRAEEQAGQQIPACGPKHTTSVLCTQRALGWKRPRQLGFPALICVSSGPLLARYSRQNHAALGRQRGATAAGWRPHSKWRRCGALPAGVMAADSRRSFP